MCTLKKRNVILLIQFHTYFEDPDGMSQRTQQVDIERKNIDRENDRKTFKMAHNIC